MQRTDICHVVHSHKLSAILSAIMLFLHIDWNLSNSKDTDLWSYCTLTTGCSNNTSRSVVNWTNMGFVMHHASWWTPIKISKIWTKIFMALMAEFPFQKQPKFSVLNNFSTFSCHVTHHNPWWTLCQWTLSIIHHRLWTSGRKGTVYW